MANTAPVKISNSYNTNAEYVAASSTAVKAAYDKAVEIASRFDVVTISNIGDLPSKQNGWYYVESETLAGVSGSWIITRFGNSSITLYTATNTNDPRVVLNSVDLSNWYSPYGSWHV